MKLQDFTIDATREAMDEAFRYAKTVPADKLEWKPMDAGQSVLSMCRELAQCADWTVGLLETGAMDWSEESQAAGFEEAAEWKTAEACETAAKEKLEKFAAYARDYPDAKLKETVDLPFGPNGSMRTFTMGEIMDYPRWNATYHLGQIGYVQTLYGDKGMH